MPSLVGALLGPFSKNCLRDVQIQPPDVPTDASGSHLCAKLGRPHINKWAFLCLTHDEQAVSAVL